MNWNEIAEPLRVEFKIPTNHGQELVKMVEPMECDLEHVAKDWVLPASPRKTKREPVEHPGGRLEFKEIDVAEDDPDELAKFRQICLRIEGMRNLAVAEVALEHECKPGAKRNEAGEFLAGEYEPGFETPKQRVEFLRKLPPVVQKKLILYASSLSQTRMGERYEEAKKA